MFELIDRQSWLDYKSLPAIVREGLLANKPTKAYPLGIGERIESIDRKLVTGQQPGFGGGPLYSTLKRWTSAALAGNDPIHNLYWVEAGDSDWNEIAHIPSERETLRWEDSQPGVPVGDRNMPADFWERIHTHWQETNRVNDIISACSGTVRDSFFTFHKLCDPATKETIFFDGPPFLLKSNLSKVKGELSEWFERLNEGVFALEKGIARVTKLYGTPQATLQPNRTGWFWVKDTLSPRIPVERLRDEVFRIGEEKMSATELAAFVKNGSGFMIPGALWRTLLQQALLHPTTVVVGAAEAAYWGEVAELFTWAGMRFPKLVLRVGATVLPANAVSISHDELYSEEPPGIEAPPEWQAYAAQITALDLALEKLSPSMPEHLRDAIAKGREKALYQLNRITELGVRYRDEQSGSRRKRWAHARELAFGSAARPPQERWMTLLEAYIRWGAIGLTELREKLFAAPDGGRFIFREL